MDQSPGSAFRGHARTRSVKATRPRSSTKGPLDADEAPPAASPVQSAPRQPPQSTSRPSTPPLPSSPTDPGPDAPDLSYLLRPEIYHPLSHLSVPAPFRNSPKQPSPAAPLDDLLAGGHYRAAAISAAHQLQTAAPADPARVLALLYARLASLALCGPAVAAQEARALGDARALPHWPLRVLAVRLQALGFGDPRRAVMSYYELAAEARARLRAAGADMAARELWRARLAELGVRVAGALVEMDDLAGAAAHLATLKGGGGEGPQGMARALLCMHLGDVQAARECVDRGEVGKRVVEALAAMADGDYAEGLRWWEQLREDGVDDEMVGVNMAVCLLYIGRMQEGKALLEGMVGKGYASHTLLFNLSTMYELSTERSRALKLQLAERVASMPETQMGWEKVNADFKL